MMKRISIVLGLAAAAAVAAPVSASAQNDGPWWDPARTGTTSGRVDNRTGTIHSDTDARRADGTWRAESRDRNGNTIYVRRRVDSNGNVVIERARRDSQGRYQIIDRRVADRGVYDNNNGRSDGQWHVAGTDRNGNRIFVRERYDSNGNRIVEYARRDSLGRYVVYDRQVANSNNRRASRNSNDPWIDRDRDGIDDDNDRRIDRDRDGIDDRRERARKVKKNKSNNGNHYGWEKGKGNKNKR